VFTGRLAAAGIAISMDGRGRWMDNVFIERVWRCGGPHQRPMPEGKAPVAQLDKAPDYESGGRTFESFRARQ
jgi:hypothetical protein